MKLFLSLMFTIIVCTGYCQQNAKSIFFEAGGPATVSVNADMRFGKKTTGAGLRLGLGGFLFPGEYQTIKSLSIPVELNYFIGVKKNYLELGTGLVYKRVKYNNKTSPVDSSIAQTNEYLSIAFRFLPNKNNRFVYRACLTALLSGKTILPIPGLSIGMKIGKTIHDN